MQTIRSHMVEVLRKLRYSKIDQECLTNKIEKWKSESPSDRIYFQPNQTTVDSAAGLLKFILKISDFNLKVSVCYREVFFSLFHCHSAQYFC